MFFVLSKILGFLISPLVWVFGLCIGSMITKREVLARRLRIAAAATLFLASNPFLVDECFRAWEPVTPDIDTMDTHYSAAIILGGIGDIDLRLEKINFGASVDRLLQPLPMFYQGRLDRIVFTGGSGSLEFPDKKEGRFVKKYLLSIGFPDSALICETESRNTYENAIFTKTKLDSAGIKGPMLLVTSGFHMRRSLAIFEKAGYKDLQPYITNRYSGGRRFTPDHLIIPSAGALASIHTLFHEMIGYMVYKLKGYA